MPPWGYLLPHIPTLLFAPQVELEIFNSLALIILLACLPFWISNFFLVMVVSCVATSLLLAPLLAGCKLLAGHEIPRVVL